MNIKHITVVLLILVSTIATHQVDTNTRINYAEHLQNQIQRVERSHSTGSASHVTLKTPFEHNGADFDTHVERFFSAFPVFGVREYRNQLKLAGKQRDMHFADRYTTFFEQHHNGMKVFGSGIRVHFNEDHHISSADGIFVSDLGSIDTSFAIEEDQAREIALNHFSKTSAYVEDVQPMIYRKGLFANRQGDNCATWCCTVTDNQMRRDRVFVHAQTGEVLASIPLVHSIQREAWQGAYLVGEPFWEEGDVFPTNDTEANLNLNVSLDVYTAFQNAFNYTSYDNNDTKMITVFELVDDPLNPVCPNAFWNGTVYASCPGVSAFDVAAHEWGHAYIQFSADLIYLDQSGAINEGFADIIGESIQLFFATDYPVRTNDTCNSGSRWIIGEDLLAFGLTNGVRDMYNPNCFQDPRSVNDTDYVECGTDDQGGVHTNSGIVGQLYSLSVDGGELNGINVTGVGLLKGFHIYMRTLLMKLTPSSTFNDLAIALEDSCNELVGLNLTDPVTGNTTTESITATDCISISDAINATELTSPFCSGNNVTLPEAPTVFFAFPPIGEIGNFTTTVYFLALPGFTVTALSNATCLIIDEQLNEFEVDAELLNFELFFVFACPVVNNNYTAGEELFITVSGDGEHFSSFGLNFTFVEKINITSFAPTSGFVGGGTVVTITGDNFEEFEGCQPFETHDANGDVYDCLTCIFGDVTVEHLVAAEFINTTTITCKSPPYYSLVFPNETVNIWVSLNAQLFTTITNFTFTYNFEVSATPTGLPFPSASQTRTPNFNSASRTPTRSPFNTNASRSSTPRLSASRTPTRRPDEGNSAAAISPFFAFVFASFAVLMTVLFY